jgi:phosphoribosylformimino-5-aminoimidazole carboxamide ribotide isomerase
MRIIPVVDLMGGYVVRGIAGRRQDYRPIQSHLASDARPATIADALANWFGFREIYIADLDAISGSRPAWHLYRQIADAGLQPLVDAGIRDERQARQLAHAEPPLQGIIAGLETIPGPQFLSDLVQSIGPDRLVFSLDLRAGRPLADLAAWKAGSAQDIARTVLRLGVRRMIVLDLAQVGTGAGVSVAALCGWVRRIGPDIELIAGGGVRGIEDVRWLSAAGCDAALVASALHDGRITPRDVRSLAD